MFNIGELIDNRYEVKKVLNEDFFGPRFLVFDYERASEVVLTFLLKDIFKKGKHIKLAKENLDRSINFDNPNIISVYGKGEYKGFLYYVTESSGDISLRSFIDFKREKKEEFSLDEIYYLIEAICNGLSYLHKTLTHKSLTPAAILLNEHQIKITGFILNSFVDTKFSPELFEAPIVKPYIAPESWESEVSLTKSADIYSLGVILFEMITGQLPQSSFYIFERKNIGKEFGDVLKGAVTYFPSNRFYSIDTFFKEFKKSFKGKSLDKSILIKSLKNALKEGGQEIGAKKQKPMSSEPKEKSDKYKIIDLSKKVSFSDELSEESDISFESDIKSNKKEKIDKIDKDERTVLTSEDELKEKLGIIKRARGTRVTATKRMLISFGFAIVILGMVAFFINSIWTSPEKNEQTIIAPLKPIKEDVPVKEIPKQKSPTVVTETKKKDLEKIKEKEKSKIKEYKVVSLPKKTEKQKPKEKKDFKKDKGYYSPLIPIPREKCPEGMVYIETSLNNFCIDKYEYPNDAGKVPIYNVSFSEAKNLCKRRGKRLCARLEWYLSCSGGIGNTYPYGKYFIKRECNTMDDKDIGSEFVKSGDFKGCRTKTNIFDMLGNLAEWVEDEKVSSGQATIIGASYDVLGYWVSCNYTEEMDLNEKSEFVGFRCCK